MKRNLSLFLVLLLGACSESDANGSGDSGIDAAMDAGITQTTVTGVAQKGPLVAGSALTLQVLDSTMTQTGESFTTDIQNDDGFFSLGDVDLGGNPFLEIFADGFYYNEVTDEISNDRLSLFTLAEPSGSDININVLSHLERPRTRYLYENPAEILALNPDGTLANDAVRDANSSEDIFRAAKSQAQGEVLAAFEVDTALEVSNSETLSIEGSSTGDQVLTAISVILQSYRSVGEMTELLANLSEDLETDGTLDSQELLNDLFTGASFVNTETVTEHLAGRFSELDEASAGGFVTHFENFLANTSGVLDGGPGLPDESPVIYANIGGEQLRADQPNVLSAGATCIPDGNFGFAAEVPDGFALQITLTVVEGYVSWGVQNRDNGWDVLGERPAATPDPSMPPDGSLSNVGESQTIVTDLASDSHEAEISFIGHGVVEVAYFANGLSGPYLTKNVTVVSCDFPVDFMDPEDPDAPPVQATVCDYSNSDASCDNPLERNDTPAPDLPGGER